MHNSFRYSAPFKHIRLVLRGAFERVSGNTKKLANQTAKTGTDRLSEIDLIT